ncbi:MAG: creatininase family protein [Desulfarculus sp.]|jgi:creatinine amidohydrolase|nr:MAG: creatininase family protein [Desulfarculus sp.]
MKEGEAPKSFLMDMTWQEFKQAAGPHAVVVIPLGSAELEGAHLPVGVDTIAAEGVARMLAGLENVIIAPTIPIGYSKWFLPYPGTISLEQETLLSLLRDYCLSLVRHGIKRIVFLNSHRGNNAAVEVTAHGLIDAHQIKVGMLNLWKLANDLISGQDIISEGRFTHAGEIMTSVIMALRPETVVSREIKAGQVRSPEGSAFRCRNSLGDAELNGVVQTLYLDIRQITDTGVMGDPTTASAEKGRRVLELLAAYARQYLSEFARL